MTAGTPADRPAPPQPHSKTARAFYEHSTATRINTECVIVESLRAEYPQLHLTVCRAAGCNIVGYAEAGHAGIAPIASERDRLSLQLYAPPASRLDGGQGTLMTRISFGKYLVDWKNKEFVLYVVDGRDGSEPLLVVNQYILSSSVQATNDLLLEVGKFGSDLHNEVWVFDRGYWQKSAELWDSVQKASWSDVILDPDMKRNLQGDVKTFFESRDTYERLRVPWKRGIIYYGPPGNGKTISIKAIMNDLYARKEPVPTLYVRTLASVAGPEYSVAQIFAKARRTAPCLLVFEDLDSLVDDRVRSYFLNEVDGIRRNDGILMIGSTNHLERLDPGISKRPSRFDRKYLFSNPNEEERTQYMKFWQAKLSDNDDIDFPDKLCPAIAKITDGFSFAYMQEAMVSSLLVIARREDQAALRENAEFVARMFIGALGDAQDGRARGCNRQFAHAWAVKRVDDEDPGLDQYVLWRVVKKQVRLLREELDAGGGEE